MAKYQERKEGLYQKERSKYRQKPTKESCTHCGSTPSQSCHLVDWLTLRKLGVPPELCSPSINIISLCQEDHWILDDRRGIWVKHMIKIRKPENARKAYNAYGHEFNWLRKDLLEELKPQINDAKKYYNKLIAKCRSSFNITIGETFNKSLISGIDTSELAPVGKVTVYTWKHNNGVPQLVKCPDCGAEDIVLTVETIVTGDELQYLIYCPECGYVPDGRETIKRYLTWAEVITMEETAEDEEEIECDLL